MARSDDYGSMGGVPKVESTGGGGQAMGVRASPNDFGANVGEAEQQAGQQTENLAIHFQQIAADSLARDTTVKASQSLGDLVNRYKQQKGLNALGAYPAFQQQAQKLYDDTSSSLPNLATKKMFQDQFSKELGYSMKEAGGWAAGQTQEAQVGSYKASITNDQNQLASAAGDLNRQQEIIDKIHSDSLTLSHTLGASPEEADANFSQHVGDGIVSMIQGSYKTNPALARGLMDKYYDGGVTATRKDADGNDVQVTVPFLNAEQKSRVARESYYFESNTQKQKDGQIAMSGGQVINNTYGSSNTLNMSEADMNKPAPLSVRNNNPGNIEDPATGKFREFGSPEEGMQAMHSDLAAKITGNSPAMKRNFGDNYSPTLTNVISTWAPSSENDTKSYINTVSQQTGIAPDKVLTTADIAKIMPAMIGVEGGDKASNHFGVSPSILANGRNNPQQMIDGAAGNPQMQHDIATNLIGYTPLSDDALSVSKATGDAQGILKSAVQVKATMLQNDPAGFVMQHNSLLNSSQTDVLSNPLQNNGLASYAKNMDFIYDSMKQPADQRPLFSKDVMENFAQKLSSAPTGQGLQALSQLKTQTGAYWPRIETQLAQTNGIPAKLMVGLDVAPNMQNTFARAYETEDQTGKKGTEKKDFSDLVPNYAENSKAVESTLSEHGWNNYIATLDQQGVGDTKLKAYQEGVRNMSMQLILGGSSAPEAAAAAVKAFTDQYDIPTDAQYKARIPKNISSVVKDNADSALDNMKSESLNIPRSYDQAQGAAYVNDIKTNGHWINNPDNTGLIRVDGNYYAVRNKDGSLLTVPFTNPAQGHAAAQEIVSSKPPLAATVFVKMGSAFSNTNVGM